MARRASQGKSVEEYRKALMQPVSIEDQASSRLLRAFFMGIDPLKDATQEDVPAHWPEVSTHLPTPAILRTSLIVLIVIRSIALLSRSTPMASSTSSTISEWASSALRESPPRRACMRSSDGEEIDRRVQFFVVP